MAIRPTSDAVSNPKPKRSPRDTSASCDSRGPEDDPEQPAQQAALFQQRLEMGVAVIPVRAFSITSRYRAVPED